MTYNIHNTQIDKMTYVTALTIALEALDMAMGSVVDSETEAPVYEKVIEKLTALRAQTEKRNNADRKPTKKQVENQGIADCIRTVLRNSDAPLSIGEMREAHDQLALLSPQKLTGIVSHMADVTRTVEKRVNKYSLTE